MIEKVEVRKREKLEEPSKRVDDFEVMNWARFINRNVMSAVRFFSGPSSSPSGGLTELIR